MEAEMKLKNKNTGEIVGFDIPIRVKSLAELNEEWEDYEERKQYWFIRPDGDVSSFYDGEFKNDKYVSTLQEDFATVGNIFETKEEAEQKLKEMEG